MTDLVRGANIGLAPLPGGGRHVVVTASWQGTSGAQVLALPLAADGTAAGPALTTAAPEGLGAVRLTPSAGGASLDARLADLPVDVARLSVVAALPGGSAGTLDALRDVTVVVTDAGSGTVLARFVLPPLTDETALVLGDLYRHSSGWKFRAVGQGYADGLAGLARATGLDPAAIELQSTAAAPPPPPPPPAASPPPPPPAASPPSPAAGPSRVVLTKAAPTVSLTKRGAPAGVLRVNLNWTARPGRGGALRKLTTGSAAAIDLDLGCLYELSDGSKSVVQALGNRFRSANPGSPLLWLDADDRSGTSVGGENLYVDLGRPQEIRRVLVYAFIYEGTPNWAEAQAVVTLHQADGAEVVIHLDEADPGARSCAIALLENVGGEIQVRREVRYVRGAQRDLDDAYGWGMRWQAGRK